MNSKRSGRQVLDLGDVAPLLRVSEAAEVLRVHPESVRRLIRSGELVGVRITGPGRGRLVVPRGALLRLLRSRLVLARVED